MHVYTFLLILGTFAVINIDLVATSIPHGDQRPILMQQREIPETVLLVLSLE